jgi:hypothetical protein
MSDLSEEGLSEAALAERINMLSRAFVASRCPQIVADLGVADWIGESAEAPAHLARRSEPTPMRLRGSYACCRATGSLRSAARALHILLCELLLPRRI